MTLCNGWNTQGQRVLLILHSFLFLNLISCQDEIYTSEIHRLWPSLKMPNVIISKATSNEEAELNINHTRSSLPTAEEHGRKTVVFPSPVCISLPIAPCIILQVFWRNSSSNVLGVQVPTNRIPSLPRPRERQLSNSQLYKVYFG